MDDAARRCQQADLNAEESSMGKQKIERLASLAELDFHCRVARTPILCFQWLAGEFDRLPLSSGTGQKIVADGLFRAPKIS